MSWLARGSGGEIAGSRSCYTMLGVARLTSYPDRQKRLLDYRLHGKLEVALAALVATVPEFFAIDGNSARKYFRSNGAILTILPNLSSFGPPRSRQ